MQGIKRMTKFVAVKIYTMKKMAFVVKKVNLSNLKKVRIRLIGNVVRLYLMISD